MERAAFYTTVNGLPYMVVALKFTDGRTDVSVHVERKGKWARLNEYTQGRAFSEAVSNVVDQINEFLPGR